MTRIQWNVTDKTDFAYDVMGNLKQATLPTGTVLAYSMDGLDRRVYKTAGGSYSYRYLYEDQYRIAAQINASGAYTKEFIYATKVNVPDYMITGGNKFRIITDHLGSPRLVVRTDTGVVVQRMDYNTLGLVTADSSPGFQPYAFAGGIHDTHTLLVKFGARDYDPRATGRWTTKDPIRFDGGDTNLYGYVLNDPVNWIDYSGLYFEGYIANHTSARQQAELGAAGVALGAGLLNWAVHAPSPIIAAGLAAAGAFFGLEGGANLNHVRVNRSEVLMDFLDLNQVKQDRNKCEVPAHF